MQKSGNKPQSIHRRVVSSNVARQNVSRKVTPVSPIRISSNRSMAEKTMAMKSRSVKPSSRMIERDPNAEIITPIKQSVSSSAVPEDVQLLPSSDSDSELMTTNYSRMSAREIKERAIAKALSEAAHPNEKKTVERPMRSHFNWTRVLLALGCATAAIFAIVYFVNINSPDISLKVAALQTGIEASYPSYIPRDYSLSGIVSENGKITLTFGNSSTGDSFSLIEEKSAWDSNALMNNYVRAEYGDDYTVIREQGLTLFVSDSNAAWVNGGIVYKLNASTGLLTKKQIKAIATSL